MTIPIHAMHSQFVVSSSSKSRSSRAFWGAVEYRLITSWLHKDTSPHQPSSCLTHPTTAPWAMDPHQHPPLPVCSWDLQPQSSNNRPHLWSGWALGNPATTPCSRVAERSSSLNKNKTCTYTVKLIKQNILLTVSCSCVSGAAFCFYRDLHHRSRDTRALRASNGWRLKWIILISDFR